MCKGYGVVFCFAKSPLPASPSLTHQPVPALWQLSRLSLKRLNRLLLKNEAQFCSESCLIDLLFFYNPKLLIHSFISSAETLELNLSPSSQFPLPAISSSNFPESPSPELEDVQNGITVLPEKSLFFMKSLTGHAAIPHHIG